MLVLYIILYYLIAIFSNPFTLIYMGVGVVWFIAVLIIKSNLKNPKNSAFNLVRVIVDVVYAIGFIAVCIAACVMTGSIGFM